MEPPSDAEASQWGIQSRGVAQSVGRYVRDVEVAGSSPVTPTIRFVWSPCPRKTIHRSKAKYAAIAFGNATGTPA